MASLPLAGIRVIDFGRFIAGPYCGMLLADMGADVIRIDRRNGSEDRFIGPVTGEGTGGHFLSLNRNKRSLTLDTGKAESAAIVEALVRSADVVVANLSRGMIPALLARYPDALVVNVTAERDVIARRLASRGREKV